MTVLDNIKVGCHSKTRMGLLASGLRYPGVRIEETKITRLAWDWARFVGLDGVADRLSGDLSLGQQRLLELARALAMEPQIVLLDEPGSGLNESERQAAMLSGTDTGLTVLLVFMRWIWL
jgi:branched-chain amino acid transport system ATP-binding protein